LRGLTARKLPKKSHGQDLGPVMSDERRKYYRYPVTTGSEAIVVRHHGVERPARLVNLSSDGFRVDMEEEEIVEVGDIVLMATSNGFHRVRVVNVARENGTLQLGLQRLQDLPANAVEKQAEREGRPPRKAKVKESLLSTLARLAVPLGLAAMIIGGIAWAWTTESDPVATVVEDGFVTPRSDYSARRRRQGVDIEEVTAGSEKSKRRISGVVADNGSSSTLVGSGGRSMGGADPGAGPERSGRAGDSGELAEARQSSPGGLLGQSPPVFDVNADPVVSIRTALSAANRENKRVLVEFGGNTCDSCSRLNAAFTQDAEIATTLQKAFVLVMVDMEANQKLAARYDTLREQVPFLALLNREGKIMKRRRTDELQAGSKLDVGKVKEFLQQWSRSS
jgi:thioredoxin 1